MIMRNFGADLQWKNGSLCCKADKLYSMNIDASQIPDLVPIIAVTSAFCGSGETRIYGAKRLRIKESNRLYSVADGLRRLGGDISETDDGLIIRSGKMIKGGEIKGYNDHRIVMSFSVAALRAESDVIIDDAQSINKSYPNFFEDYNNLGGEADVIDVR